MPIIKSSARERHLEIEMNNFFASIFFLGETKCHLVTVQKKNQFGEKKKLAKNRPEWVQEQEHAITGFGALKKMSSPFFFYVEFTQQNSFSEVIITKNLLFSGHQKQKDRFKELNEVLINSFQSIFPFFKTLLNISSMFYLFILILTPCEENLFHKISKGCLCLKGDSFIHFGLSLSGMHKHLERSTFLGIKRTYFWVEGTPQSAARVVCRMRVLKHAK